MASMTGYKLPQFPEPLNIFVKQGNYLNYVVDRWRYDNGKNFIEKIIVELKILQ